MPICPKCREENPELGAKCPRDGHYYIYEDALKDVADDAWIGKLAADKYVILSLISEGGMGAVYRAMQLPVQREIAFKVLRADLNDSDQGHDRFAREARAISKLMHPNIITMHDFGVDDRGHPFMAMEYAPGRSLADWMMQPGLSLERIEHVFSQILSALSEAHAQGIVHRDLKPENLIVTRTGSDDDFIKLLDFGIARMVHDGATRGLTREGEVFGTPHYMSPEQAQGSKEIGPPADVYALGIMLYELLSGQCPFDAPTPLSILYMHINDELPELRPRNGLSIPDEMRQVIDKATAKEADDRYAHAGEMLEAFQRACGRSRQRTELVADSTQERRKTEMMGSAEPQDKATAETLMFDEADQAAADPSDRLLIDGGASNDTTFELEGLGGSPAKKWMAAGAMVVMLLAGGVVLMLNSSEGAADGSAAETESTTAASAGDSAEPAAETTEAEVALNEESDAGQEDAGQTDHDTGVRADNADVKGSDPADDGAREPADRDESTGTSARASSRDIKPSDSTASGASAGRTTTTGGSAGADTAGDETSSGDDSGESDDQPPTPAADDEPEDDGPTKFERKKSDGPKKFERKRDPDDDPDKPRKWR